jgi:hypothetical protein
LKGYRSAFTKEDLLFTSTPCNAGQYTKIGEYKIVAGELVKLGYLQGDQAGAEGRIHIELKNSAGTTLSGTIRLVALSPQDMPLNPSILFEARTEALNQSSSDRTKQIPFNDLGIALSEDKKYAVNFKPDGSSVTVDKAKSTVLMDITRVLLK